MRYCEEDEARAEKYRTAIKTLGEMESSPAKAGHRVAGTGCKAGPGPQAGAGLEEEQLTIAHGKAKSHVGHRDPCECEDQNAKRAEPVCKPAARDLHQGVRREDRSCEQSDLRLAERKVRTQRDHHGGVIGVVCRESQAGHAGRKKSTFVHRTIPHSVACVPLLQQEARTGVLESREARPERAQVRAALTGVMRRMDSSQERRGG